MSETQEDNIRETGRRAFKAGLNPSDNPFRVGSLAWSLWIKSYLEAERKERTP